MSTENQSLTGLNQQQVEESRAKYGVNILTPPPNSIKPFSLLNLSDNLLKLIEDT